MSNLEEDISWLNRLGKHYQPIFKHEEEFVNKGKIAASRVEGFHKIFNNLLEITGDPNNKRILDIGSNFGWFSFKFNDLGADCVSLEVDCRRVSACESIAELNKITEGLYFHCGDSTKWIEENPEIKFDYVVLLNTIHHIFVQDEERCWTMFNHLINTTKGVIIMMRSKLKGWQLEYPKDIPRSIIEQSDATHVKAYERVHGRTIYHFWREDSIGTSIDTDTKITTPTKL